MRHLAIFFSAILVCLSQGLCAELRTWTDNSGNYRVIADFVDLKNGIVRLRKADGKILSVPIDRLSKKDQSWIAARNPLVGDLPQRLWPLRNKLLSAQKNIESAIANARKKHKDERDRFAGPLPVAAAMARINYVQNTIGKMQKEGASRVEAVVYVNIRYFPKTNRCSPEHLSASYSIDVGGARHIEHVSDGMTRIYYDVAPAGGAAKPGSQVKTQPLKLTGGGIATITIVVTPQTAKNVLAEAKNALRQARKGPPELPKRQKRELDEYVAVRALLAKGNSALLKARQVLEAATDDPGSLEAQLQKCEEGVNSSLKAAEAELQRIRAKHSRIEGPAQGGAKKPRPPPVPRRNGESSPPPEKP